MKLETKLVLLTLVLVSLVLTGCVSVPKGSKELQQQSERMVPPEGKAGIYVFRPMPLLGVGSAVLRKIELDTGLFGYLAPSSYLYGAIPPGEHSVGLGYPAGTIELTAEEGVNHFFKISLGFPGEILKEIDNEEARKLIREFTLSRYNIFENLHISASKEFSASSTVSLSFLPSAIFNVR